MFSTGTGQRTDFPSALLTTDGYRGATVVEDFGYRAIERFKGIADDNTKYGFFENIIEALYTSENFDDETLLKDSRGRKHKSIDIVVVFLKSLCDYSIKNLQTCSDIINVNDSYWVLMIPSVRAGSRAVDFFRKAWHKDKYTKNVAWISSTETDKLTHNRKKSVGNA
ncbi:uncharacterized protein LOC134705846 [Mytilus trossulus]|uniref:uncharacterized protein LOC134705846 n=1 Tax=Mytilus trossulus TaxID=6551 RepID=UPI003007C984